MPKSLRNWTIEACILLHAAPFTPFLSCTHSPCTSCISPSSLANVARCSITVVPPRGCIYHETYGYQMNVMIWRLCYLSWRNLDT
ncbi:hypothetical protein ACS0TY_033807 [Phlomoides rotata]